MSRLLSGGESRRSDPALHHALVALDEFQFGQPEQVAGMVHSLGGAQGGQLSVLTEKAGQLQLLQVVFQQQRGTVVHAAFPRQQGHVVSRAGGADPHPGQVGVELQVEAGRPSLQPAHHQVLYRIEAESSQAEGIFHRGMRLLPGEGLQQSQHLHEFPLAPASHPGLQQPAQCAELLGQVPPLQRSRLVQGAGLLLQERQVVDGIVDEVVSLIGAGVPGDDLRAAADDYLIHIASHQHVPAPVGHRRRVVVGPVPHQRQGTHPARLLVARVVGHGSQGQQGLQVPLHPLADGLGVAPEPGVHPFQAAPLQVGVQRGEALEGRYGRQKVPPHVAHHAFDFPLVVALPRAAEPVLEQVVGTGAR